MLLQQENVVPLPGSSSNEFENSGDNCDDSANMTIHVVMKPGAREIQKMVSKKLVFAVSGCLAADAADCDRRIVQVRLTVIFGGV